MIWQCTEGILQLQGSLTQVLYSLDSKAMLADEILEELHRTDATTRALHNLQDTLRASGVHVLHAHVARCLKSALTLLRSAIACTSTAFEWAGSQAPVGS